MKYLEPYAMKKQCGDCAFDPKSDAGKSPSAFLAELCVESSTPFHCHRYQEGEIVPRTDDRGEEVLCKGFVDALAARGPRQAWQLAAATECLKVFEESASGKSISFDAVNDRVIQAVKRAAMESEQ